MQQVAGVLDKAISAACPRCAYSMTGELMAWHSECPCVGRCVECGLDFRWGELLGTENQIPSWSIESPPPPARRWRARARAAEGTLIIPIVRAGLACRTLRMEQRLTIWRMLLIPALVLCVALLITVITVGISHGFAVHQRATERGDNSTTAIAWALVMGLGATVAPISPWTDIGQLTDFGPEAWRAGRGGQGTTFLGAVAPPLERFRLVAPRVGGALFLGWSITLGAAVLVASLPQTRRRFRVRTIHIVRMTVYALPLWLPLVVVNAYTALLSSPRGIPRSIAGWHAEHFPVSGLVWPLVLLGTLVLHVIWWRMACTRYLRVPHGLAIGAVGTIVGVLVITMVVAAVSMQPRPAHAQPALTSSMAPRTLHETGCIDRWLGMSRR